VVFESKSFIEKQRDELPNRELLLHIGQEKYVANHWRMDYICNSSYSSLDNLTSREFAKRCIPSVLTTLTTVQTQGYDKTYETKDSDYKETKYWRWGISRTSIVVFSCTPLAEVLCWRTDYFMCSIAVPCYRVKKECRLGLVP